MRIAHAIHGLGLGGAQKIIASIVRGRQDRRLEYFVYSCDDGVFRAEIEAAGATVRILPRHLPKLDPFWIRRLAAALRDDQIDLVHTHLFGDTLHGYLAAQRAGRIPMMTTLHIGPEGWNRLQRLAYPHLLAKSGRAVACSESVRANVDLVYPRATRVMEVISNGIEPPPEPEAEPDGGDRARLLSELGLDPSCRVVATVGRLSAQKGYRFLLSALAQLIAEDPATPAQLVLLGDGELRQELENQAQAEGIAKHVVFAGFRSDVAAVLRAVDIVVFSSLYEGLPIALLEAMAAGCCLVVTDIPGNLDAVRHEDEALVVPAGKSGPLARALARLITDTGLRTALGAGARRRFEQSFTAAAMVGRYERLYRSLLGLEEPTARRPEERQSAG